MNCSQVSCELPAHNLQCSQTGFHHIAHVFLLQPKILMSLFRHFFKKVFSQLYHHYFVDLSAPCKNLRFLFTSDNWLTKLFAVSIISEYLSDERVAVVFTIMSIDFYIQRSKICTNHSYHDLTLEAFPFHLQPSKITYDN